MSTPELTPEILRIAALVAGAMGLALSAIWIVVRSATRSAIRADRREQDTQPRSRKLKRSRGVASEPDTPHPLPEPFATANPTASGEILPHPPALANFPPPASPGIRYDEAGEAHVMSAPPAVANPSPLAPPMNASTAYVSSYPFLPPPTPHAQLADTARATHADQQRSVQPAIALHALEQLMGRNGLADAATDGGLPQRPGRHSMPS